MIGENIKEIMAICEFGGEVNLCSPHPMLTNKIQIDWILVP